MIAAVIVTAMAFVLWTLVAIGDDDVFQIAFVIVCLCGGESLADTVTVARVIDGDTFDATDGRRVDLAGIDAPAIDEHCGGDAFVRLTRLVNRKVVELKNIQTESWGRQTATVVSDGTDASLALLKEGLATLSGDVPQPYVDAVQNAKLNRLGLWRCEPMQQPQRTSVREVVLYWTHNCAPCEMTKPHFARLARQLSENGYTFRDTDARVDAFRANVNTYPQIVVYENGREIKRHVGAATYSILLDWLRR